MFCHKCGKELPEGSKFCPSCGAQQQIVVTAQQDYCNQSVKKNSHPSVKILIGTVASIAISVISIIAIFFPSFLNFEKKSIQEFSLNINSQKDANKLHDFLVENRHKIVKLDLQYSPKKIQASNYVDTARGIDFTSVYQQDTIPGLEPWGRGAVVTYPVINENKIDLYDIYTNELLQKVKLEDEEGYQLISETIFQDKCSENSGKDCRINKGVAIKGRWYCHTYDIYCHQENVAKYGDDLSRPSQNSLYYLPDYPYLSALVISSNLDDYLLYRYRNINDENIIMDESVLFGEKLTFLSNHQKATYKDGVVNIDHGTIGFITDGTDEQLEPYVLIGELSDDLENIKSIKIEKSFMNGNLVNIFKTQENAFDSAKEVDEQGNFKSLLTTLFKVENNKLSLSKNCKDTIAGKFFPTNGDESDLSIYCYGFENGHLGYANIMYNQSFDQSFSVEIPYSTQNNTLYTWKSDSLKNRYLIGDGLDITSFIFKDSNEKIILKGIFYVYGENEASAELGNYMPYSFCGYEILNIPQMFAEGVSTTPYKPCKVQKIIKLKPLSSVDLEKLKY